MVIVQFRGHLVQQYRALILLGRNYLSYITVLCVQGIPILSLLIFMPSPCSNLKNFSFTFLSFLITIPNLLITLVQIMP